MPVVLIAEDDLDIRNLIGMALKLQNLDVIEAFDGQDAWIKILQHHPDILVLDINMPKMNGFEVCEKIRKHSDIARTPVIMISARVEQEDILKSRLLGVDTLIEKPFDFAYLASRIHGLLKESGVGREL